MLGGADGALGAQAWLVNTGWTGGPYGTGERMNIHHTRLDGPRGPRRSPRRRPTVTDPIFGVEVPTSCPDVPSEVLQPRATWPDPKAYDRQAKRLAAMFVENFERYAVGVGDDVRAAGPRIGD